MEKSFVVERKIGAEKIEKIDSRTRTKTTIGVCLQTQEHFATTITPAAHTLGMHFRRFGGKLSRRLFTLISTEWGRKSFRCLSQTPENCISFVSDRGAGRISLWAGTKGKDLRRR